MSKLEQHKFSDPNFDSIDIDGQDVWIYTSTPSDLKQPNHVVLSKDDVIALAKHYEITPK